MGILMRGVGAVFVLVAFLVAVNWVASSLIDNSSGAYPTWRILNWPTAACIVVALVANYWRKHRVATMEGADGPVTRRYVEANVAFYASLLLFLWFFWNWLAAKFPYNEPEEVRRIHLMMWAFISPVLTVPVLGTTGFRLWREGKAAQAGDAE